MRARCWCEGICIDAAQTLSQHNTALALLCRQLGDRLPHRLGEQPGEPGRGLGGGGRAEEGPGPGEGRAAGRGGELTRVGDVDPGQLERGR